MGRKCGLGLVCLVSLGWLAAACGDDGAEPAFPVTDDGGAASEPTCPAEFSDCDGVCIDTRLDPDHCGACESPCGEGLLCSAGACGTTCFGGSDQCGDTCVDLKHDPANCGDCGVACADGEICSDATCGLTCLGGTAMCEGTCVDPDSDDDNCGGCGIVCDEATQCNGGMCCQPGEVNCDGTCVDLDSDPDNCDACGSACTGGDICYFGSCEMARSCKTLRDSYPSEESGVKQLDPDGPTDPDDPEGPGSMPATLAYCDMSADGGGWTLIARFSNNTEEEETWMNEGGEWWYDKVTTAGAPESLSDNEDMIAPSFWSVVANDLRITRSDDPTNSGLLTTIDGCLDSQTFRDKLTGFGNFRYAPWGTNSVKGSCDAQLGGDYETTSGFAYTSVETCSNPLVGGLTQVSFWADWDSPGGDAAVMMIGGGGDDCGRADHGIGTTEQNDATFAGQDYDKVDFGDTGKDSDQVTNYALNLWVR